MLFLDLGAYLLSTYTSICWLCNNEDDPFLFSISCLLLDFKFLLFFRAFEVFGVYFVIIISVARSIFSFLFILFIIFISFAHAFFILLKPKHDYSLNEPTNNDDTNNPWSLTNSYYPIENGEISSNPIFVQKPDKNTNMFIDYGTALFSTYLYLTGIYNYFFFES